MARRAWVAMGALACLAYGFGAQAQEGDAPIVKGDRALPNVVANTFLLEAEEPALRTVAFRTSSPAARSAGGDADGSLSDKSRPRTCSAVAVKVPHHGVRVVTAAHCAGGTALELFDGQRSIAPRVAAWSAPGIDLVVLDLPVAGAFSGLAMRPAAGVPLGERLCAWRVSRAAAGLRRERICARLMSRTSRPGTRPWLVMSHPYPSGTSGSPLVDAEGRVVGIVVASNGLAGFAEPIESIDDVAPWGKPSQRTGARRAR